MKHPWIAITEPAPEGFELREELVPRELRRSAFALFAESFGQAEAALEPYRGKVVGLVVTYGDETFLQDRGDGLYHLSVAPGLRPLLPQVIDPQLAALARILELSDATRQQALDLTRAAADRNRIVKEFSDMRSSLLKEIAERRAAQDELQQAHDELEVRVRERTAELALSLEALEDTQRQLRAEKANLEADLDLAREFQVALLPEHHPEFMWGGNGATRSLRFFHFYEPSGAVGGDFFHILRFSEKQTGIFFCDVMGHGVRSALMSAILRGLLEQFKEVGTDPGRFLTDINHGIAGVIEATSEMIFVTAFFMVVDLETLSLRYANAGHPRPFHLKRSQRRLEQLSFPEHTSGPALGITPDTVFPTLDCQLSLDDTVLIYTDGIYEVDGPDGEEFGRKRLRHTIETMIATPVPHLIGRVVERARAFSSTKSFTDDVCLVAMQVTGKP